MDICFFLFFCSPKSTALAACCSILANKANFYSENGFRLLQSWVTHTHPTHYWGENAAMRKILDSSSLFTANFRFPLINILQRSSLLSAVMLRNRALIMEMLKLYVLSSTHPGDCRPLWCDYFWCSIFLKVSVFLKLPGAAGKAHHIQLHCTVDTNSNKWHVVHALISCSGRTALLFGFSGAGVFIFHMRLTLYF